MADLSGKTGVHAVPRDVVVTQISRHTNRYITARMFRPYFMLEDARDNLFC